MYTAPRAAHAAEPAREDASSPQTDAGDADSRDSKVEAALEQASSVAALRLSGMPAGFDRKLGGVYRIDARAPSAHGFPHWSNGSVGDLGGHIYRMPNGRICVDDEFAPTGNNCWAWTETNGPVPSGVTSWHGPKGAVWQVLVEELGPPELAEVDELAAETARVDAAKAEAANKQASRVVGLQLSGMPERLANKLGGVYKLDTLAPRANGFPHWSNDSAGHVYRTPNGNICLDDEFVPTNNNGWASICCTLGPVPTGENCWRGPKGVEWRISVEELNSGVEVTAIKKMLDDMKSALKVVGQQQAEPPGPVESETPRIELLQRIRGLKPTREDQIVLDGLRPTGLPPAALIAPDDKTGEADMILARRSALAAAVAAEAEAAAALAAARMLREAAEMALSLALQTTLSNIQPQTIDRPGAPEAGPCVPKTLQFPDGGITVDVMEAILRDDRITAEHTTDRVCHTIIKPATVPHGWIELIEEEAMPWGTLFKPSYQKVDTGLVQSEPPAGTMCLADKLKAMGHAGVGTANVFFSHAWKFRFVDVVAAMRTFADQQCTAGNESPIYFWFDCAVVDEHASQSFPPAWWVYHW
jgi:hypothetical protein